MELPYAVVGGAILLAVALALPRLIGPRSTLRRRIPGVILLALGLALLRSQLPLTPARLLFGTALLLAWGGTGLALIANRPGARLPGLLLAGAGLLVAGWVDWRIDLWANEPGRSGDRVLVDVFFLADGPVFSWEEVALACSACMALSALAAGLLLLPSRPPDGAAPPGDAVL